MNKRSIDTLPLDGGCLCLDFINTVHNRTVDDPFEYLSGYDKLLEWAIRVKLISVSQQEKLASAAMAKPGEADRTLVYILKSREVLYELFLAIARAQRPDESKWSRFNTLLREGMSHLQLGFKDDLTVRQGFENTNELSYPLTPIIKSAYDLLTSDVPDRIKECGACGWLFLDQSKNKSRKWCSMENCGSNVKAKRYYHRHKND